MASRSNGGASGGRYVSSSTGNSGSITFTVNLPQAGTYTIWGRVLAPNASRDSYTVTVDGGQSDVYDVAENRWSGAWQWTAVNGRAGGAPLTLNPRTFTLSAGTHTIRFAGRDSNTGLDQIVVTNDPAYVPQ